MPSLREAMNVRLMSYASRRLEKRGWNLVADWQLADTDRARLRNSLSSRHLEEKLPSILARTSTDCVLDVGANEGQFGSTLRDKCAYEGHIYSYEPLPHLAENLRRRIASDERWHVEALALGHEVGESTLYEMESSTFSSLHLPLKTQMAQFVDRNRVVVEHRVKVSTIEQQINLITSTTDLERFFLKVDTQGNDLAVLQGLGTSRALIAGVLCELSFTSIYDGAPRWLESVAFLESSGFEVVSIDPIAWDDETLRLVEADCLMIAR